MKQKKLNKQCKSSSYAIGEYAYDLAFWDEIDFTEFELTKLNYLRRQIEKLWVEKCSTVNVK